MYCFSTSIHGYYQILEDETPYFFSQNLQLYQTRAIVRNAGGAFKAQM
ncbi:hypothetical protein [Siphonobacter sp.]